MIIIDSPDFKTLVPEIHKQYNFKEELKPKIEQIIMEHIIPFIGQDEYDELQAEWEDGNYSDNARKLVVRQLRYAIAHYTALELYTTERVNLSAAGVTQTRTSDDSTMGPASYHSISDVKNLFAKKADGYMERALAIMEKNLVVFSDWSDSSEYESLMSCLIYNSEMIGQYTLLPKSMRTLLMLRADLLDVQEVYLRPQIGDALLDTLLDHQSANSLSAAEKKALGHIRRYMSRYALLRALPKLTVEIGKGGVWIRTFLDGPKQLMTANAEALGKYMDTLKTDVEGLKARMIEHLEANAADFPDYTPEESDSTLAWRPGRNTRDAKSYRT